MAKWYLCFLICCLDLLLFSSKEQVSFNFMAIVAGSKIATSYLLSALLTYLIATVFKVMPFYIPSSGIYKGSRCSITLPVFSILDFFLILVILMSVVVSHCAFNLHFPDNYWYWVSFHMPTGHLYIFLCESSVKSFAYFLAGLFIFFLLSCRDISYKIIKSFIKYMYCKYMDCRA